MRVLFLVGYLCMYLSLHACPIRLFMTANILRERINVLMELRRKLIVGAVHRSRRIYSNKLLVIRLLTTSRIFTLRIF